MLGGCSANDDIPSPLVSNIDPDHATAGALVTLHGNYFCQRAGVSEEPVCDASGSVHFDTVPGTPAMWIDTAISVEVPAGVVGRVSVTVIAGGRASNSVAFTVE